MKESCSLACPGEDREAFHSTKADEVGVKWIAALERRLLKIKRIASAKRCAMPLAGLSPNVMMYSAAYTGPARLDRIMPHFQYSCGANLSWLKKFLKSVAMM